MFNDSVAGWTLHGVHICLANWPQFSWLGSVGDMAGCLVAWLDGWLLGCLVGCAGCYCEGRSSIWLMWGLSVSYLVEQPGRRVIHTLLCIIFDRFCLSGSVRCTYLAKFSWALMRKAFSTFCFGIQYFLSWFWETRTKHHEQLRVHLGFLVS